MLTVIQAGWEAYSLPAWGLLSKEACRLQCAQHIISPSNGLRVVEVAMASTGQRLRERELLAGGHTSYDYVLHLFLLLYLLDTLLDPVSFVVTDDASETW